MTPWTVLLTIALYFAAMLLVSRLSGKGDFYGTRKSHPLLVTIAMIGACMSGVTFVSVPGMVGVSGMGYLQMCLGFMAGYVVIAFVLMPLYYRLQVVSIYQYLEERFGLGSYRTGAWLFFISKMLGASVRLFLVCLTEQLLIFDPLGLPFALNVVLNVAIVLAYTFRGGVHAVIWTDVLKTLCMVVAVALSIVFIGKNLGLDGKGLVGSIHASEMSRIFFFDDVLHPQYFWKQFLGGLFTVLAMTGLDQDMMQRALSSRNSGEAKRSLLLSSLLQTVVIFLFLCLGVLLYRYAAASGIAETGDKLFPAVATGGGLPLVVGILFVLGLVSTAYGAGGSALTSLTTSFTVDILGKREEKTRRRVHLGMAALMALVILVFNALNSTSAIDAVYKIASYTYGPLLGMFAFGILTKKQVRDRWVPLIAVAAPLVCLVLQLNSVRWMGGYQFSYEILPLNAGLTFLGLYLSSK
jgi:Na+/proline symporter